MPGIPNPANAQGVAGVSPVGTAKSEFLFALAGAIPAVAGAVVDLWSAKRQQDFQEEMSNTSYRRAVRDMYGAGLNPMLAYQQGGASTPSGASASPGRSIAESSSTAAQLKTLAVQRELMDAQRGAAQHTGQVAFQDAQRKDWEFKNLKEYWQKNAAKEYEILEANARESSARAFMAERSKEQSRWDSQFYEGLNRLISGSKEITWDDVKRFGLGWLLNYGRKGGYEFK